MPGAGEPLWLDDDRDWALALLDLEADACAGCGQPRSESMTREAEFGYIAEPIRCHACAALARATRDFAGGETPGSSDGLNFTVRRREV